jgi:hypothetical protein
MKQRLAASWLLFAACGTSVSSSSSPQGPSANGTLSIRPANGSPAFVSSCVTQGVMFGERLDVFCNEENNQQQQTRATIVIEHFHGTDTYVLDMSSKGTVQFIDTADVEFSVDDPSPGRPVTSCTIDAQGPASPKKGDVVSGTFHCENLGGVYVHLPPGVNSNRSFFETVDGSFQVTMTL